MGKQARKQLIAGFERDASRSLICKWKRNFYGLTTSRGRIYHNSKIWNSTAFIQPQNMRKVQQSIKIPWWNLIAGARSPRRTFVSDCHSDNFHGSHLHIQVIICSQLLVFIRKQTPLNRCQSLPASRQRLLGDNFNKQYTFIHYFLPFMFSQELTYEKLANGLKRTNHS